MNPVVDVLGKIFSKAASGVIDSVGEALDKNLTNKEEKAAAMLAITQEVNRHFEAEAGDATKQLEMQLADIANSRDANVKIQDSEKASFWSKNTAYFLDVFIGTIWGSTTIFIVCKALKLVESIQADMTAVLSIYSTITAIFMISVNFHRGTSVGSANKQKTIDAMTAKI